MLNSMYFQLSIKLFSGFIALLISLRLMGKRQISQITPFDFISAVILGEIVGNTIYDNNSSIFHLIYGIVFWTILILLIEKFTQKMYKYRDTVQGSPVFVIKKGQIDFEVLNKEKLDFGELISLLRAKDVFSIQEVDYAILEPSGVISVIKKPLYAQPTNKDLNIKISGTSLNLPLVLDGDIVFENLKVIDHDEDWLIRKLNKSNINNVSEILYAEWNSHDGLYIQKKQNS